MTQKYGDWNTVSGYAGEGYTRGRRSFSDTAAGAGAAAASTVDRAASGVERPATSSPTRRTT